MLIGGGPGIPTAWPSASGAGPWMGERLREGHDVHEAIADACFFQMDPQLMPLSFRRGIPPARSHPISLKNLREHSALRGL